MNGFLCALCASAMNLLILLHPAGRLRTGFTGRILCHPRKETFRHRPFFLSLGRPRDEAKVSVPGPTPGARCRGGCKGAFIHPPFVVSSAVRTRREQLWRAGHLRCIEVCKEVTACGHHPRSDILRNCKTDSAHLAKLLKTRQSYAAATTYAHHRFGRHQCW